MGSTLHALKTREKIFIKKKKKEPSLTTVKYQLDLFGC